MFTFDATIDAVQTGKKTFVNTFVTNETVKEAMIDFIENQVLDLGEVDIAFLHKIEKAARGCNQHVHAALQHFALGTMGDTPMNHAYRDVKKA